jgi:hypothetical protein
MLQGTKNLYAVDAEFGGFRQPGRIQTVIDDNVR